MTGIHGCLLIIILGIIAQDEDGYYGDVEIVKGLATNFIKNPSCLILLTITCESKKFDQTLDISDISSLADLENQGAGQLAKEFDPDFERTIGMRTN